MVAGAVIQNRQDMALLPNSGASGGGEQSASASSMVVGESSSKITAAATGTIEKRQPMNRGTTLNGHDLTELHWYK
jgi:hypothetical protein